MSELEVLRDPYIYLNNNIILYGAGNYCDLFMEATEGLDLKVKYICDKNYLLHGTKKREVEIISPHNLKKMYLQDYIIIITSSYYNEIISDLNEMGIQINIYTDFAINLSIYLNIDNGFFVESFVKQYKLNDLVNKVKLRNFKNYYINWFYYIREWSLFIKDNPILVFQAGKVGSKSLLHSIKACGVAVNQPHTLAFRAEYMDEDYYKLYIKFKEAIAQSDCVKIITAVREPISRDIAHIFQHIDTLPLHIFDQLSPNFCESIKDILIKYTMRSKEIGEWIDYSPWMIHHLIRFSGENGGMIEWFNRELKKVFDVDVFEYPFDKQKGYTIISKGNIRVLVLKLEKMDDLQSVIGDFIGQKNFELKRFNDSKNKNYYFLYNEVLRTIQLPKDYIDFYYNNKYIRHFYSDDELNEFRKKWVR